MGKIKKNDNLIIKDLMSSYKSRDLGYFEVQKQSYYAGIAGFYSKKQKTGKFIVLLRSGNILKDSISLYGGAGIMPISDPYQEWQETAKKMKPMMTEFFNL